MVYPSVTIDRNAYFLTPTQRWFQIDAGSDYVVLKYAPIPKFKDPAVILLSNAVISRHWSSLLAFKPAHWRPPTHLSSWTIPGSLNPNIQAFEAFEALGFDNVQTMNIWMFSVGIYLIAMIRLWPFESAYSYKPGEPNFLSFDWYSFSLKNPQVQTHSLTPSYVVGAAMSARG